MLDYIKKEANLTNTENGAVTHASSLDHCLDLFATAGGLRHAEEEELIRRFVRAYAENPDIAMRILFYARDVRSGLGERRLFRVLLRFLCENHKESVVKNLPFIAECGRYDDYLELLGTSSEKEMLSYLKAQWEQDIYACEKGEENVSLLAKWLPSVNTSNKETVSRGRRLAKAFGMSEKEYRKTLSMLRKKIAITENFLRTKDYSFSYEHVPGKAMKKYVAAFTRNDRDRYQGYLNDVSVGEAKMNTATVYPYEIIRPFYHSNVEGEQQKAIETMWYAQKDYTDGRNALVVVDGSGSMYNGANPSPIEVAHSLAMYFAERNKGAFANHFITFSTKPQLVEIKGKSLLDKLRYTASFNEVADTNIQAVFELILNAALKNSVPQEELPETIYIVSDMEFNICTEDANLSNFEYAKELFELNGYKLPKLVFWNVASRKLQLPVTKNEQGVALVSGCTPKIFELVMEDNMNPYEFMLEVVNSARYENITA